MQNHKKIWICFRINLINIMTFWVKGKLVFCAQHPSCFEYIAKILRKTFFSYVCSRPSLIISICQELPEGSNKTRAKVSIMQILQLHLKDTFRILRPQFCKPCEAFLALGGSNVEMYVLRYMFQLGKTRTALLETGTSRAWGTTGGCQGFPQRGQSAVL